MANINDPVPSTNPLETSQEMLNPVPLSMKPPPPAPKSPPKSEKEEATVEGETEDIKEQGDEMEEEIDYVALKKLEKRATRYTIGFCLDLMWCNSVQFDELLELIKYQGWVHMLSNSANNVLVPDLMDDFCASFEYEGGNCKGRVNGTPIEFNAEYLSNLFRVPNEGYDAYFKGKFNLKLGGATMNEIMNFFGGEKGTSKIDHNRLSPLHKLLFNVVWRTILPRTQKRNEANLLDISVMYCLAKKIKINFPALMIQHLEHCVPKGFKVGYGALLTTVFESLDVELDDLDVIRLKGENKIQESTLLNLGIIVVEGKCKFVEEEKEDKRKGVEKLEQEQNEVPQKKGNRKRRTPAETPKRKSRRIAASSSVSRKLSPQYMVLSDEEKTTKEQPTEDCFSTAVPDSKEHEVVMKKLELIEAKMDKLQQTVLEVVTSMQRNHEEVIKAIADITTEEVPVEEELEA